MNTRQMRVSGFPICFSSKAVTASHRPFGDQYTLLAPAWSGKFVRLTGLP
jgi:hypothetical protein